MSARVSAFQLALCVVGFVGFVPAMAGCTTRRTGCAASATAASAAVRVILSADSSDPALNLGACTWTRSQVKVWRLSVASYASSTCEYVNHTDNSTAYVSYVSLDCVVVMVNLDAQDIGGAYIHHIYGVELARYRVGGGE